MLNNLLFTLFFFLPAGIANMTPIFTAKLPILKKYAYPLDCYQSFRGKRILGNHKTVRGLISGICAAILVTFLQTKIYINSSSIQSISPINYHNINPIIFGMLSALGALGGDALESFFKRQKGIESGKAWFPFDQIDYILGGVVFTSLYVQLSWQYYLLLGIVWFILHLLFSYIGYHLKLKSTPI